MPCEIPIRGHTIPDIRSLGQATRKRGDRRENRADLSRVGSRRGAIPIFTRSNFPRCARTRVPDVPARRSPAPGEKTFDEPAGTTTACRPCRRGRIYREQFSTFARSLARSSIPLTLVHADTRARMHRMRERAAWVTSHACTGRTAPLEYLSVCSRRVGPTIVTTIERARLGKKHYVPRKLVALVAVDSISLLNATKKAPVECP